MFTNGYHGFDPHHIRQQKNTFNVGSNQMSRLEGAQTGENGCGATEFFWTGVPGASGVLIQEDGTENSWFI